MRDWLKQVLLHNWWLKLASLGLAYVLWVVVTQAPPVEVGLTVPLELRNVPENLLVAGEIPSRVHLRVRGPEGQLRMLEPEEVGVAVDLTGATPGNHSFRLEAANVELPPGVEVVRIIPNEVRLELAPR